MACHKQPMTREQIKRILEVKRRGDRYQKSRLGNQGYYCEECKAYHLTARKNWHDGGIIVKRKNAKYKNSALTNQ